MGPGGLRCFAVVNGQSVAGISSQPRASALFNPLTGHILKALETAEFAALEDLRRVLGEGPLSCEVVHGGVRLAAHRPLSGSGV